MGEKKKALLDALKEAGIDIAGLDGLVDDAIKEGTEEEIARLKEKNKELIKTNSKLKTRVEELETEQEQFTGLTGEDGEELDPEEIRAALEHYRARNEDDKARGAALEAAQRENRTMKKDLGARTKDLEKASRKAASLTEQIKRLFKDRLRAELAGAKVIPEMMKGASGEFELEFREEGDEIRAVVMLDGEEMAIEEGVKEWVTTPAARYYLEARKDLGGGGRADRSSSGVPEKGWKDMTLSEKNRLAINDPKKAQRLAAEAGETLELT